MGKSLMIIGKRVILAILISTTFFVNCSNEGKMFEIGDKLPEKIIEESESNLQLMTSSGSFHDSYMVVVKDVVYDVAINQDSIIVFIGTSDTNFRTPEGIKVGTPLSKVLSLTQEKLFEERGWAYHVRLPSGWRAAFTVGHTMTDNTPSEDEPVKWLFKRFW
jgi:hypothetical protein